MLKQAFAQVSEVAVRVLRRGHALVYLHDMHAVPRQLFSCQGTEHLPRGVATTYGQDEAAPCSDRSAGLRCHDRGSLWRDGIGIGQYGNLHAISYRGFVSFLTKSASEEDPTARSSTSSCTTCGDMSKT